MDFAGLPRLGYKVFVESRKSGLGFAPSCSTVPCWNRQTGPAATTVKLPVISDCLQLHSNCQSFRTACNYSQIASHFGLPATTVKLPVISDCLQHQSKCQSFRTACNSLQLRAAVLNSDWSRNNLPVSACKCLQLPATGFRSENPECRGAQAPGSPTCSWGELRACNLGTCRVFPHGIGIASVTFCHICGSVSSWTVSIIRNRNTGSLTARLCHIIAIRARRIGSQNQYLVQIA